MTAFQRLARKLIGDPVQHPDPRTRFPLRVTPPHPSGRRAPKGAGMCRRLAWKAEPVRRQGSGTAGFRHGCDAGLAATTASPCFLSLREGWRIAGTIRTRTRDGTRMQAPARSRMPIAVRRRCWPSQPRQAVKAPCAIPAPSASAAPRISRRARSMASTRQATRALSRGTRSAMLLRRSPRPGRRAARTGNGARAGAAAVRRFLRIPVLDGVMMSFPRRCHGRLVRQPPVSLIGLPEAPCAMRL